LVAARIASEVAERIRQPAVLMEIIVGAAIGPSLLGIIHPDDLLRLLGQLGAVLLLFDVGMQMNLPELRRVGGDSARVAAIGLVVPMVLALIALRAMGLSQAAALFLAGGITATSVGITARVFGDLRALATPEARTVLGAAVADDIGGLLILAVVVALSSGRPVNWIATTAVVAGSLAFVVMGTVLSVWLAPRLFKQISKRLRSKGTLMAAGLALALGISLLASAANLAPIVGAFIAGLALSQADEKADLQAELAPLVHFFVPIFFLVIGIDTKLGVFTKPSLLVILGALCVIAILGKIAAGLGVLPGRADRFVVGVAMIPRGEVGLIFAGIGLAGGVLSQGHYAVLVAVALLTTVITPPWLRHLIQRARRRAAALQSAAVAPPGGWLQVSNGEVELSAEPPDVLAGLIGLESAVLCADRKPGAWLLQWLSSAQVLQQEWDQPLRERFFGLLRGSNERSWRFLQATGLLAIYLPGLDEAMRAKPRDSFDLDTDLLLNWRLLEDLNALTKHREGEAPGSPPERSGALAVWDRLEIQDLVLLSTLARVAFGDSPDCGGGARGLALSIGLDEKGAQVAEFLLAERRLLAAAARRIDMGTEDSVLELAAHIGNRQRADALYVLAVAEDGMQVWERERLDTLFELVQAALAHPGLDRAEAGELLELRKLEISTALSHLPDDEVERHLREAPRRYLVAHGPDAIARHLKMVAAPLDRFEVRMEVEPEEEEGEWFLHLAAKDRRGLLAKITGVFAERSVSVREAFVSTWRDGAAIDVFRVKAPGDHDWEATRRLIEVGLAGGSFDRRTRLGAIEGTVDIDNLASPWHTIVEVRAYDRRGLLHRVASALAVAGIAVHMALVNTADEVAVDIFYVTGRNGGKLSQAGERDLRRALSGRSSRRLRVPLLGRG